MGNKNENNTIKKDLTILKEGTKKIQELRCSLCEERVTFIIPYPDFIVELNKHQWYIDYVETTKKYEHIFSENGVLLEPYECSSLEDFLTIAIVLFERK